MILMSNESRVNVLVTGVGAIIGYGIIKSLRQSDFSVRIVGLDRNPQAFGAKFCDAFYPKNSLEETQEYWDFLRSIIDNEQINMVLPGIEEDVFCFYDNLDETRKWDTSVILNSQMALDCGRDKWEMYRVLVQHGNFVIPTLRPRCWEECLTDVGTPPFIMKPIRGSASRGQQLLTDKNDFTYWQHKLGDTFIVQKLVGTKDDEFTVSVFGFGDGTATSPAVLRRWLGASGATSKAETVSDDSQIRHAVDQLNHIFLPLGPTNYQFRKHEGQVFLLEINPRISSSTSIRCSLGVNEAHMCIEYFLHGEKPAESKLRNGFCQRYIEDIISYL